MTRAESPVGAPERGSTLRRGLTLIRHHLGLHPVEFAIAVTGAAVFAICTIASSWAVRRLVDRIIVPAFKTGRPSAGTVIGGVGVVIGIGVVRAAAVIVRRSFAGRARTRPLASLTA